MGASVRRNCIKGSEPESVCSMQCVHSGQNPVPEAKIGGSDQSQ